MDPKMSADTLYLERGSTSTFFPLKESLWWVFPPQIFNSMGFFPSKIWFDGFHLSKIWFNGFSPQRFHSLVFPLIGSIWWFPPLKDSIRWIFLSQIFNLMFFSPQRFDSLVYFPQRFNLISFFLSQRFNSMVFFPLKILFNCFFTPQRFNSMGPCWWSEEAQG